MHSSQRAGPPLHGVLHAGGVLADGTLAKQTLAGMRAVRSVHTQMLLGFWLGMRGPQYATGMCACCFLANSHGAWLGCLAVSLQSRLGLPQCPLIGAAWQLSCGFYSDILPAHRHREQGAAVLLIRTALVTVTEHLAGISA